MKPMHAIAAAVIALAGLGLSPQAEAAPKDVAGVVAPAGEVVLAGHRDRDHRRDWRHSRDHRRDWRHSRDHRRDWDRDRGRKHGWDRGRGDDRHWGKQHKRWQARHHPRHRHWVGRHFPRVRYVVIHDYGHYYLPPPRRGHFYARVDNDVFLVAEGTKRIIDAFVLFNAVGR